jgi:hypothetical protein
MIITFEFGFWFRKSNAVSCRARLGVVTGQLRLSRKSQRPIVTTGIFVNRFDRFYSRHSCRRRKCRLLDKTGHGGDGRP